MGLYRDVGCRVMERRLRVSGMPLGHTSSSRPETSRELLCDKAPHARCRGRRRAEAPDASSPFNSLSDRAIDLGRQRGPSATIRLDGEGGHCPMVQPKSAILVLFYDQAQRIYLP
jgi:hypothetical protein